MCVHVFNYTYSSIIALDPKRKILEHPTAIWDNSMELLTVVSHWKRVYRPKGLLILQLKYSPHLNKKIDTRTQNLTDVKSLYPEEFQSYNTNPSLPHPRTDLQVLKNLLRGGAVCLRVLSKFLYCVDHKTGKLMCLISYTLTAMKKVPCHNPVRAQLSENTRASVILKEFLDSFDNCTWSNDLASQ